MGGVSTCTETNMGRAGGKDTRSNGTVMTSDFWLMPRDDSESGPERKHERSKGKAKLVPLSARPT